MSVVLTTKAIKLWNKETIKTRKEVRKIRPWKLTERRIGVTQWSLTSAVGRNGGRAGAERGRSCISNIYILLPCRFFIVISNAPKQIGKRIEVSKDFTVRRILISYLFCLLLVSTPVSWTARPVSNVVLLPCQAGTTVARLQHDCSTTWFQTSNLIQSNRMAFAENKTQK